MAKSEVVLAVDRIQAVLRPFLKDRGFRVDGRTFRRATEDGFTQVVHLQAGASDPPGTVYVGPRVNLYGLFTVNLGVFLPEVALGIGAVPAKIHEYDCHLRARLGRLGGEVESRWWSATPEDEGEVAADIRRRLERDALPYFERVATRERLLAEWRRDPAGLFAQTPARIVVAVILIGRGEAEAARALLEEQIRHSSALPTHQAYVRALAPRLGLDPLST